MNLRKGLDGLELKWYATSWKTTNNMTNRLTNYTAIRQKSFVETLTLKCIILYFYFSSNKLIFVIHGNQMSKNHKTI